MKKVDLSIIYVYYNTPHEIVQSLKSISNAVSKVSFEIIVVDNASPKKLPKVISKIKRLKIIKSINNDGFGAGVNMGVKFASGNYFLFINPDTIFHKNSIDLMFKKIKSNKKIGIIGPKYLNGDGVRLPSISSAPFLPRSLFAFSFMNKLFPRNKYSIEYWLSNLNINREQEVDVVGGACMLVSREVFEKVGGFDKRFFMYFEEADFCVSVGRLGYKILYYPKSVITHFVGRSMDNREWVQHQFEKSRLAFFKKYHNLIYSYLAEYFFRITNRENILLSLILLLSIFLNFYRLNDLMLLFGDSARDFIVARDMVILGKIPIVGIQSSVTWLRQGPLSIYIIALSFLLSNFNPVSPAYAYAAIGVISTLIIFKVSKLYVGGRAALLATLFYATSPLIITNARLPYHTSAIPLLVSIILYLIHEVLNKKNYFFILFFSIGILLQLELAAVIFILPIILIFYLKRVVFTRSNVFKSICGFLFGVLPFILFDLLNGFSYSIKFPLWILNRIRIFVISVLSSGTGITHESKAIQTIIQQLEGIYYPESFIIFCILVAVTLLGLFWIKKNEVAKKNINIIILFTIILLFGFYVHSAPGPAYFPLLFPMISILLGFSISSISLYFKPIIIISIFLFLSNSVLLVFNDYYITTLKSIHVLPPQNYSLGSSWRVSDEVSAAIVADSRGKQFQLSGGGILNTQITALDTYKYLIWLRRGKISVRAKAEYIIYPGELSKVENGASVVFKNRYNTVVRKDF